MSTFRTDLPNTLYRFFSICAFAIVLLSATGAFGEDLFPCTDNISVDLNSTSRFFLDAEGVSGIFALETDSKGLLAVHATIGLGGGAEPQLRFLGADCRASLFGNASVSETRSYVAGEEIRVPSPGTYYVQVKSQNPSLPLGEFKLIVGFAGYEATDSEAPAKDGTGAGETEPEEVDETIPMLFDCPAVTPPSLVSTKDGTGAGETEPEEVDETIPVISGCPAEPAFSERLDLCRLNGKDDVGDVFTCASPLTPGTSVTREIRNDGMDDQDIFALLVEDWRTLRVVAQGDFELLGAIYDRRGQRMVSSHRHDGDGSFALVRALAPDIYFIRIDGLQNAEGVYSLTIEDLGW